MLIGKNFPIHYHIEVISFPATNIVLNSNYNLDQKTISYSPLFTSSANNGSLRVSYFLRRMHYKIFSVSNFGLNIIAFQITL